MLQNLILYNCDIRAPPSGGNNRQRQTALIKQESLKKLNLSHNNLASLLGFLSGTSHLFTATLETLTLVNVGLTGVKSTEQFARSIRNLVSLYELDVSENAGIEVDQLLLAIQES